MHVGLIFIDTTHYYFQKAQDQTHNLIAFQHDKKKAPPVAQR